MLGCDMPHDLMITSLVDAVAAPAADEELIAVLANSMA
jgi:hypothetical protein